MEIVEDISEKNYNNNGEPWKSSRILRVNPNLFIFLSFFIIFLHFFRFLHFFIFSFFLIFSFSFFFSFFHFSLFSFFLIFLLFFFMFLSFLSFLSLFLFWVGRNPIFLDLNCNMFYCWHQYQSSTVSSEVGAPWRWGVLTT